MKKNLLLLAVTYLSLNTIAFGYDTYYLPDTTPYTYQFNIYREGEVFDNDMGPSTFNLTDRHLTPLNISALTWKEILNVNPSTPAIYAVGSVDEYNAFASSPYVTVSENPYKISLVNAILNNKTITTPPSELEPFISDGRIFIGLGATKDAPGWAVFKGKSALYHEYLPDLYSISTHEIMHSLGLSSAAAKYKQGDNTYYFSKDSTDPLGIHDYYLRIYKGNPDAPFDATKELKTENGMALDSENFDALTYSPYFVGENTLKVLSGKDNAADAKTAIINNGGILNYSMAYDNEKNPEATVFKKVFGLPIHPTDNPEKDSYDLSHIELRNSFMSHQSFRNWIFPMEAEQAYLKDIGYNVDLRKYFGKSYYLNNVTDTYTLGYSEWDGTSYTMNPSQIDQGVGIHIYGNNNNITQAANSINTEGTGSFGVRIDGVGNTYTLDSSADIITNGDNSIGIGATWGKGHTINVSNGSTVQANGKDGIAVSFDFGESLFGSSSDKRGSYIYYDEEFKENYSPSVETQGALVENFNTSGTLEGKAAAIYISDNAYVKNININNNSVINGDIISKWNSVTSGTADVLRKNASGEWASVDKDRIEEIYFTNLNFSGTTNVNGNIDGSNDTFNTLVMNNTGNLNFNGEIFNIYTLGNTGTINFINTEKSMELGIQNGAVTGNGTLVFNKGVSLNGVNYIENTVDINNTFISLIGDSKDRVNISKLNSDNADLYLDYGDTFVLQNDSDAGRNQLTLKQIAVGEENAKNLDSVNQVKLFEEKTPTTPAAITLDVNTSASGTNFYYNKNKYTFSQDTTDKSYLKITKDAGNYEVSDAIADPTSANYIVTDSETVTKDLGTVQGDFFEISGEELNAKGNKGLVVDGSTNSKTILKTDIIGASDSSIVMKNNANMLIDANDDDIEIATPDKTAVIIDNSELYANAENNEISFKGDIVGLNTNTKNIVALGGNEVNLNKVDNVVISTQAKTANLNDTSTDTIWQISDGLMNVGNDNFLSSDGTNKILADGGAINFANNRASDINLSQMTLNTDLNTSIDVDLLSLEADKFVFANQNDLVTNGNGIKISNINLVNPKTALYNPSYNIPFVNPAYNNKNLLTSVDYEGTNQVLTPVFKYNLGYTEDGTQGDFVLSRGSTENYESYNPSVFAAPVAAQLGGYFAQLNSYDEAFHNMDAYTTLPRAQRLALKYQNKYAAADSGLVYDSTLFKEERPDAWFRPYTTFENVRLDNGPKVSNIMYGNFMGGDSPLINLGHGWEGKFGGYVGYNGSHQTFNGVSMYQNGGTMGGIGVFYKGNFFTGLTSNMGASAVSASTMYGRENFAMMMSGGASKTGYNFEFKEGKYILQPSWLMSYSLINTFEYNNAAGVTIDSDYMLALQLQPELKFIGNLKNGWQPYASVAMVWNIMDKTKFSANDVSLPELSVQPYVRYGLGIRKNWGERFTGFFQSYVTNGGRTGVGLSAGFRWAIGK
ncbi:hypothetical protein IKQ26_00170 [bacterium]|nr:hypothetical protein [bacterium]